MRRIMSRLFSTPSRSPALAPLHPLLRRFRSFSRRGVPSDHIFTKVAYRGCKFNIEHRRAGPDRFTISQSFTDLQYDLPGGAHGAFIDRIYDEIVSSGRQPLIIDGGANIGTSVLWFIARYPEAHVIAIEPASDNVELLRKNCAGLDVDIRQAGMAAIDGYAFLSDPGLGEWGYRTGTEETQTQVPMLSVKALLLSKPASAYIPFLLKIDIEGAEEMLFEGDCSDINRFPLIVLEPHDWLFPGRLTSKPFLAFHVSAGRELCVKHENIASIAPMRPPEC